MAYKMLCYTKEHGLFGFDFPFGTKIYTVLLWLSECCYKILPGTAIQQRQ